MPGLIIHPFREPSGDGARRADTGPTPAPCGGDGTASWRPTPARCRRAPRRRPAQSNTPKRSAPSRRRNTGWGHAVLAAPPELDARFPPFGLSFGPDELVHRVQQQREEAGAAIRSAVIRSGGSAPPAVCGSAAATAGTTNPGCSMGRPRGPPPPPPPVFAAAAAAPRLLAHRRVSCVHDARRRVPKIDGHPSSRRRRTAGSRAAHRWSLAPHRPAAAPTTGRCPVGGAVAAKSSGRGGDRCPNRTLRS